MAEQITADVKAFLKRAAELENIIYSYEQTRDLLQHTKKEQVTDEARTVRYYQYGDTIPWMHGNAVSRFYANEGLDNKDYRSRSGPYARYHSRAECKKGHTPPDGYPNKKKAEKFEFSLVNFLVSLIICAIPSAVITLLLIIFTDVRLKSGFLTTELILVILFWAINLIGSKIPDTEPTSEAYLQQKANYEQEVNERNALLSKELGIEAYCIKAEQELAPVEANAREELRRHYSAGVVHPKYQNFLAITQIYEYFDTGRCDSLEGPNGAYNLFESELRANIIIGQLSQVIEKLEEIKQAQYMIVRAIENTNGLLGEISQDIRRVENAINVNTTAINEFNAATIYTLNRI